MSDPYEEFRPLMFSIAYRMLASASEAEDIVQEAFLRFHRESTAGTVIESPKAYLSTVTTRLAIDHLRSARVRRERYVGTWLPEPLVTDTESDVARHAEAADSLSMAFLVLLESLTPVERAVFLLREVFDYGYEEIESPKAYVSAITTRLAIDHLRSARVRRERYVGTWLPEPVLTDPESDVALHAETADSLSMAFLVLLESLSPTERAVFLLREVFEYGYDEIARVIGKSEDNCRQIAVRARRAVESHKPRFEASRERREELARRFFAAVTEGDTDGLLSLLAADVVAYGDGGGKAPAFAKPVYGRDHVARLLFKAAEQGLKRGVIGARYLEINGQPGAIFIDPEGRPLAVVTLDIADDQVQTVRAVSNPEKLRHLIR